jgi:STE24 endopeptidase
VLLSFLAGILMFPLKPVFSAFYRRHEREADSFACEVMGEGGSLVRALVKLAKDNLSNLNPHPIYVLFHYSHPPAVERIRYIKGLAVGSDQ